ncbi:hypothetical protein [Sinorhizobium terangae]|nr:hypothetical protein [Sinorhizobium terangae]MBB4188045.1 hypothetical protein [Sinorhizobium terangae]WFU49496.1 hypothetical protein QA637_08920 [Sinorhizobium terangae]
MDKSGIAFLALILILIALVLSILAFNPEAVAPPSTPPIAPSN